MAPATPPGDQHEAHAEIDIAPPPLRERPGHRGSDDLIGAGRHRDGRGDA